MRHLANAQYSDRPAGGNTGRLFLTFGGPVCADRISNCPLDRVLTYKNLIYLLNWQNYEQEIFLVTLWAPNVIMSTPLGGGHIIFAFSGVRTLGFRSFEGKVFILSLPNLHGYLLG